MMRAVEQHKERHKDFEKENTRLQETKEYIEEVIDISLKSKKAFQGNIKQAMVDLDYLDSSLSYVNILTNTKFLEMTNREFRNLVNIRLKPYFARIDFQASDSEKIDEFYIGKTSLYKKDTHEPVIVDWRSPIANLYYEGRLGDVAYKAEGETFNGNLSQKRQYIIENGELEEIRDIDITTRDEILQASLSGNVDSRLKDIVSTIQGEQNQIIRADMDRPLIVQGVAGSGKPTIALHRIAYFIYTYAENFNPNNLMILAPNQLFLDYISEVLPELGVEEVKQTTFVDFFTEVMVGEFKFTKLDEKLLTFIEKGDTDHQQEKWVSGFKGSNDFIKIIDAYYEEIIKNFIPDEDIMLERYKLYNAKKVKELFYEQYLYLPPVKRIEKIKLVLKNHVKAKQKDTIKNVEEVYDKHLEKAMNGIKEEVMRHKKVIAISDKKDAHVAELKKQSRNVVGRYIKQFKFKDVFSYYLELFKDKEKLLNYGEIDGLDEKDIDYLCDHSLAILSKKIIEVEDAAPLLYLQHKLFGFDKKIEVNNVVIDEAQDYSVFQFYALKSVLNTDLFTILGDLSQGIHSYRGTNDWNEVKERVFPRATYLTLEQSYRTTVEIMELANEVIKYSKSSGIVYAKPVVRHNDKPQLTVFEKNQEVVAFIETRIIKLREETFKTIAIIGKTSGDCNKIKQLMDKYTTIKSNILNEEEYIDSSEVAIVPSYLSKGLEFDAVIIITIDDLYDKDNDLDVKLLYVAMTRPLHRLYIHVKKGKEGLIGELSIN